MGHPSTFLGRGLDSFQDRSHDVWVLNRMNLRIGRYASVVNLWLEEVSRAKKMLKSSWKSPSAVRLSRHNSDRDRYVQILSRQFQLQ